LRVVDVLGAVFY